jgi:N-acetylmuramoyl-L-alanine amidase
MRSLLLLCPLVLAASVQARPAPPEELDGHDAHHDALRLPSIVETGSEIGRWGRDGDWLVSPVRWEGGTRLAAMARLDSSDPLRLEARPVDEDGPGAWVAAPLTFARAETVVFAADLPAWAPAGQLRIWAPARGARTRASAPAIAGQIVELGWRMLVPVEEPGGNGPGAPLPVGTESSAPRSVSQALLDIGVVPREVWGANATNCTSPENTWYRFAIHHTAGNTMSGGTVQGAVQGLQAWSMGGGGFCDIPYQFLVGFDGSLWEGRPLTLYSGATGGGNNDGNIAISHLGCFHPSCTPPDPAAIVMRAAGRLLAQTLAVEHGIVTNSDTLRGHRDYPGNSTACPGDDIHSRLFEYRSANAHFQGTVVATSWEGDVPVELGSTESLWVEVRNDGLETWTSNTRLASLPRDVDNPLAAATWIDARRASAPAQDTPPGATATFALDIDGAALGTYDLSFTLVEEWVTWFADLPIGGGPAEGSLTLRVVVEDEEVETPGDDDDDDDDDDGADDDDSAGPEPLDAGPRVGGERVPAFADTGVGCGCASAAHDEGAHPSATLAGGLLFGMLGMLRRRRVRAPLGRSPSRRAVVQCDTGGMHHRLLLLLLALTLVACPNSPPDDDDATTPAVDDDDATTPAVDDDDATTPPDDDDSGDDDDATDDPCEVPPEPCEGICALTEPVCDPVLGWQCTSPGMETPEVSCDGFDNDCDGEVDEDGVCPECTFDLPSLNAATYAAWDIDFDFDCNTYFTSLVSGPDWAKVVPEDPNLPTATYYGQANQNMGWGLVDPDPNNRRMVVTYSCCASCGCQAQNGLTLLYTCEPTDPGCGCTGQTNCPGFLDAPFIPSATEDITTTINGRSLSSPNGLAAGPRNSYYVGNFKASQCSTASTCTACGPGQPGVFCATNADNCCEDEARGRLVNFTLPDSSGISTWRTDAIFAGEEILGLATGRDGSVLIGTDQGNVYKWDPVAATSTLLQTFTGAVFTITQERPTGDWYLGVQADPQIVRLSEAGIILPLPATVPPTPPGEGVLQWGPDGQLYRLQGEVSTNATLDVYPL